MGVDVIIKVWKKFNFTEEKKIQILQMFSIMNKAKKDTCVSFNIFEINNRVGR